MESSHIHTYIYFIYQIYFISNRLYICVSMFTNIHSRQSTAAEVQSGPDDTIRLQPGIEIFTDRTVVLFMSSVYIWT